MRISFLPSIQTPFSKNGARVHLCCCPIPSKSFLHQSRIKISLPYFGEIFSVFHTYALASDSLDPSSSSSSSSPSSHSREDPSTEPVLLASSLTCNPSLAEALDGAVKSAIHALQIQVNRYNETMNRPYTDAQPNLAILFVSDTYTFMNKTKKTSLSLSNEFSSEQGLDDVVRFVRDQVPSVRNVFGCSAAGVIGSSLLNISFSQEQQQIVDDRSGRSKSQPRQRSENQEQDEVEGEDSIELQDGKIQNNSSKMESLMEDLQKPFNQPQGNEKKSMNRPSPSHQELKENFRNYMHSQEIEAGPAVSLLLGCMPENSVSTFHFSEDDFPDLDSPPDRWHALFPKVDPRQENLFILISDPKFVKGSRLQTFLSGLDFAYPTSLKVGGVGSTSSSYDSRLYCTLPRDFLRQTSRSTYSNGVVGLVISGKHFSFQPIMVQGCRGIGPVFEIKKVEGNRIVQMDVVGEKYKSLTGLNSLQYIISTASTEDKESIRSSYLFLGIAQDNFRKQVKEGEFLMRQVLGADRNSESIIIGDMLRVGQRCRFHVQDRDAAMNHIKSVMQEYKRDQLIKVMTGDEVEPLAALMFSCVGRGRGLFGEPNFEARAFRECVHVPLFGFFASGEMGPMIIGDNAKSTRSDTSLHGLTTVFTLMRQKVKPT